MTLTFFSHLEGGEHRRYDARLAPFCQALWAVFRRLVPVEDIASIRLHSL